ncbi:USP6 N-terminal-like protein isoform X1 [Equus caballus]|uniref:USP6 N-terminal-like protein isoform X1 n=1 Tax=Equus caballus TaxID=9796 RepID=UPI0038B35C0D
MKEDPETLLALERAKIIAQYDQGRQAGVPVDPQEDPELPLSKVTDRLGFLHEKELPRLTTQEAKHKRRDIRRADKWLKMLRDWGQYQGSKKMHKRVFKGIPPQVRGRVWSLLLDLEKVKAENKGKYERMKEQARLFSDDIKQIDLDVNRTFRDHIMYWDRYGIKQQALFHVLAAYSVYNTEVGYCQGMSEVVAVLLMFLGEEDAFWALAQLMVSERHAMHGFFVPGFPKLLRFQAHHEQVLTKGLPKLKQHLDEEHMCTGIYTAKWFLQCFIGRTPFSLTLKLWDTYILEGERVLTAMAYTVLKLHKKRLLKLPLEGLREFLQDGLCQPWALEDDAVLRHLQASMVELQRMKCDLPPPAKPEEFPTLPLGLERASPEPRPVLASPGCEKLPSEAWLALPHLPVEHEQPGPSPAQVVPEAEEPQNEGASTGPTAAHTSLGAPEAPGLACLPPAQDSSRDRLQPRRFTSLPNLPGNHEAADRWPPAVGSELERWASLPLLLAWATPRATGQAQPCIPTGAPVTGPIQPDEDQATGPRTPLLPCDACSRCPSQGGEGHSGDEALAGPSELPRGLDCPLHPLTSMSARKLEAWHPLEGSVMERATALKRPASSSSVPQVFMLAFLEDGAPLPQRGLAWPEPRSWEDRGTMSAPPAGMKTVGTEPHHVPGQSWSLAKAGPGLSEECVATWGLGMPHRATSVI